MLKLTQILGIDDNEFKNYKVHLATDPGDKMRPYKKLMLGQQEFTDWQESQTNKNFGRRYIISLAYIEKDGSKSFTNQCLFDILVCVTRVGA